jgi:hypothetical protein
MKKVTEIVSKNLNSNVLLNNHLSNEEVKKFVIYNGKGFFNEDEIEFEFNHYKIDDKEITKEYLNSDGVILHSETHNIEDAYYFENILHFIK